MNATTDIHPTADSAVLIYSGGIDSTTMLYEYRDEVAIALTFDYGSNHAQREISCARYHCGLLHKRHLVLPLGFIRDHFRSSLLSGAAAVPDRSYDEVSMRSTVVPFRNGILLAVAAGLAESEGLRWVMMANHGGDHSLYPDCRPEFVSNMDAAIAAGTYAGVRLWAPYTHLTKSDIVRRGAAAGVDFAHTWSCYKGETYHCGTCGTCQERHDAFLRAGIDDPTTYSTH